MNRTVRPIEQLHLMGLAKLLAFCYLIALLGLRYTLELLRGRLGFGRYFVWLKRLVTLVGKLTHNKVIRINGAYKFQLYLPAFPSAAFFAAMRKYDPATIDPGPITVVLSMTKACGYSCPHCYQRFDQGRELEIGLLKRVVREMQTLGVCCFDIEGGEPMLRFERLCELLSAFDERAEIWVNTTGHQLTPERARRMRELGVFGVYVSIHSADAETYDAFTGTTGAFERAKAAIRLLHEVGIATAINYCASPADVDNGGVERLFALGHELGSAFVQVIHGKPAGAWLQNDDAVVHAPTQLLELRQLHLRYNEQRRFKNYPCAAVQVFEEQPELFGCTAGGVDRFYLNHAGEVQPCEFLNVSFGNVTEEPFHEIFARMRQHFRVPGQTWLCCSEAGSIARAIEQSSMVPTERLKHRNHPQEPRTPLRRSDTESLVAGWDKGAPTPIYQKLELYARQQAFSLDETQAQDE